MEYLKIKSDQTLDYNTREDYLDWLCGLMILQMIAGHLVDNSQTNNIFDSLLHILSFFMPWFFFKSGMFFHPTNNLHTTIQKSFKRLIIPFIVWGLIGEAIYLVLSLIFHPEYDWKFYARIVKASIIDGKPAGGNGPLWYLFSLFIIKIGYSYLNGKCSDILLIILSLVIPATMYYTGWNWLYVVSHTLVGFFYFIAGYKLAKYQFNRTVLSVALVAFISLTLFSPSYMIMTANDMLYGNYLLEFIYSLSAIIVINNLIKLTPPKFVKYHKSKTNRTRLSDLFSRASSYSDNLYVYLSNYRYIQFISYCNYHDYMSNYCNINLFKVASSSQLQMDGRGINYIV